MKSLIFDSCPTLRCKLSKPQESLRNLNRIAKFRRRFETNAFAIAVPMKTFQGDKDDGESPEEKERREQLAQECGPNESDQGVKPYRVRLFQQAAPIAVHLQILQKALKVHTKTHLLLLTRNSHPGLIVAARSKGLKVIALQAGVKDHSFRHGEQLLRQLLAQRRLGDAQAKVAPSGEKRMRQQDLQFINVAAPEDQVVTVLDVEPQESSAWRSTLNRGPMKPEDLQQKMLDQLNREMVQNGLTLADEGGTMFLTTTKPLRDGDVACVMSGITFDRKDMLRAYIDTSDQHKALGSALLCIQNLWLES